MKPGVQEVLKRSPNTQHGETSSGGGQIEDLVSRIGGERLFLNLNGRDSMTGCREETWEMVNMFKIDQLRGRSKP
jgi:hypothetical protein